MVNDRNIKCVIVDDEEMAAKVIESHLSQIPDFEVVGVFHSAVESFLALENMEVDVLFLDIQMPKILGTDLIKMLKKKPLTILTTAYREYAMEGFELEVVDYLLKPIGIHRFLQSISRIKNRLQLSNDIIGDTLEHAPLPLTEDTSVINDHVFVRTNRVYQKIFFNDILHVESIKNHIKIVTEQENHISLIPLSTFEQQLPKQFIRVHRSFVINSQKIIRFDTQTIEHIQGSVPIGKTYKECAYDRLKDLL